MHDFTQMKIDHKAKKLSVRECGEYSESLSSAWKVRDNALRRRYSFSDFVTAMQFVNTVAAVAEELAHHPNIHIAYDTVEIEITTHSAGGITKNDFILAFKIDTLS